MLSINQSKFIKSLKIKKYRAKERCFIVEGKKNVLEAISAKYGFKYLLVTSSFNQEHSQLLREYQNCLIEVDEKSLIDHGTFQSNQDCMAVLEMPEISLEDMRFDHNIVALDGVGDPGNLGTIIRTMDWFGIHSLVCSKESADLYNPKVINSTMGSFTRVKVLYTDLVNFIQNAPIPSVGADLEGIELKDWKINDPTILVMGSESHGISSEVAGVLNQRVTITKYGNAESLNVAIATGILCQHLRAN